MALLRSREWEFNTTKTHWISNIFIHHLKRCQTNPRKLSELKFTSSDCKSEIFIGYWLQMVWKQVYDLVNNSSDMLWQIFKPSFSFCIYKPKNIRTHWNREASNTKRCCETEKISLHPRWKVTQWYKEMPFWVLQQGNTHKTLREQWKSQTKSQALCFSDSYPSCLKHRICLLCEKTETCTSKSKTSRSLIKRWGSATQTVAKVRAPKCMKIHLSVT